MSVRVELDPDWLKREYVDHLRTLTELADEAHVKVGTVRRALLDAGVEIRPRGGLPGPPGSRGPRPKATGKTPAARMREVLADLRRQGLPWEAAWGQVRNARAPLGGVIVEASPTAARATFWAVTAEVEEYWRRGYEREDLGLSGSIELLLRDDGVPLDHREPTRVRAPDECAECGDRLALHRPNQKYCDQRCRERGLARKAREEKAKRPCARCGEPLGDGSAALRKYHPDCAAEATREQARRWRDAHRKPCDECGKPTEAVPAGRPALKLCASCAGVASAA